MLVGFNGWETKELDPATTVDLCSRINCPGLVIHGTHDTLVPWSRGLALAEKLHYPVVLLDGSGHGPHARDPVKINLLIREFADSVALRDTIGTDAGPGAGRQRVRRARRCLLHHEVFGDGAPTVMLLPTWSIVHSRMWKAQIPYLARHFRVVTFDGRGCGRSGRPVGPAAYTHEQFAADAVAVLDATDTDTAVLVGQSSGARWGIQLAADHPDRVLGFVSIASTAPLVPDHLGRAAGRRRSSDSRSQQPFWEHDYPGSSSSSSAGCSPNRTRRSRSRTPSGGASTSDATTLADIYRGILVTDPEWFREACTRVSCPVLVIHGDEDAIRPHAGASPWQKPPMAGW